MTGPAASSRLAPWLFLSPFLVIFVVFTLYPLARSVVLATHQTFGPEHEQYVGARNFAAMIADPLFWTALRNTFVFALASVFIQLPISLGLALLIERRGTPARPLWRILLFSPALVGVVFAAMIFGIILEKRTGLLNVMLHSLTAGAWNLDFAWTQQYVMSALIVASLWMFVGFNMIYFVAALQNVRRDLAEAAVIDGAGPIDRFRHVTLPAIRPVAGFVVLTSIIGSFQLFELPYLMLNQTAGPDNRGLTIVMYLYQVGFEVGDLGYASAIGWGLAVVLVVCTVVQRLLARREEAAV